MKLLNEKKYAENYTIRIEKEQYALDTHDLGFMMNCSFGNGYRITGNENYKKSCYKVPGH